MSKIDMLDIFEKNFNKNSVIKRMIPMFLNGSISITFEELFHFKFNING